MQVLPMHERRAYGARVSVERTPSTFVLSLAGEVDLLHQPSVRTAMAHVWDGRCRSLLVDLTACELIDCSALAPIWQAYDSRPPGAQVAVVGARSQVRRVLQLTGFLDLVEEVVDLRVVHDLPDGD